MDPTVCQDVALVKFQVVLSCCIWYKHDACAAYCLINMMLDFRTGDPARAKLFHQRQGLAGVPDPYTIFLRCPAMPCFC